MPATRKSGIGTKLAQVLNGTNGFLVSSISPVPGQAKTNMSGSSSKIMPTALVGFGKPSKLKTVAESISSRHTSNSDWLSVTTISARAMGRLLKCLGSSKIYSDYSRAFYTDIRRV